MSNPALIKALTLAGYANPANYRLIEDVALVGTPIPQGGQWMVWIEDGRTQSSHVVELQSIIQEEGVPFNVASGARANPLAQAEVDPSLNACFDPSTDEGLRQALRQVASCDPTQRQEGRISVGDALQHGGKQRVLTVMGELQDSHPEEYAAINQAYHEVQATIPQNSGSTQGSGSTESDTHASSNVSDNGAGVIPETSASPTAVVSSPVSLDGVPILPAATFAPVDMAGPPSVPPLGEAVPVLHEVALETDVVIPPNYAAPMPVMASGFPALLTLLTAPLTVEVPASLDPAQEVTLRTATEGSQYFTNLFGTQAVAVTMPPFMRVLVDPRPEEKPFVERAQAVVSQLRACYQASLGLGFGLNSTAGGSQTAALSFHCDSRSEQIVATVGPSRMRTPVFLAGASDASQGPLIRHWPSHVSSSARYFSDVSCLGGMGGMGKLGDQDPLAPFGTFVGYIPACQQMAPARPLTHGLPGNMLTRRDGAATEYAVADIHADTGSADHQSDEGGHENKPGGQGGRSGGDGSGHRRSEDEEAYPAA